MRKRILALLMALVMVFGLNTTFLADEINSPGVNNQVELPKEVKAKWNEDWSFTFQHVAMDNTMYVFYEFDLYKDGTYVISDGMYCHSAGDMTVYSFRDEIDGTGEYQVKIVAHYNFNSSAGMDNFDINGETEVAKFTKPEKTLATPSNVKLENGVLSYDAVDNAGYYEINLYVKSVNGENDYIGRVSQVAGQNSYTYPVKDYMVGDLYDADVYCTVVAKSTDINTVWHSDESQKVGPYEYRTTKKAVSVEWDTQNIGSIKVGKVVDDDYRVEYELTFYKDGVEIGENWYYEVGNKENILDCSYIISEHGIGEYKVEVAVVDVNDEETIVYEGEATYTYSLANKLAAPTNVKFTEEKDSNGKVIKQDLTFDGVSDADEYGIYIQVKDLATGEIGEYYQDWVPVEVGKTQYTYNALNMLDAFFYYQDVKDVVISIGVRAVSTDIEKIASSDAVWTVVYENKTTAEEVEKALDEALKDVEKNPEAARDLLVSVSNDTLVEKMQDAKFLEKVKKAEVAYVKEMQITVKAPVSTVEGIASEKITVIGAGLNAGMLDEVQLTVAEPEKKVALPEGYKTNNAVYLDINLLIDGKSIEELKVPVTITMPIPEGVETKDLVILHYHGDATEPVIITPVVSEDGKMMTFTVSGFSTFVVTNVAKAPDTADNSVAVVCAMMLVAAAAVVVFKKRAAR